MFKHTNDSCNGRLLTFVLGFIRFSCNATVHSFPIRERYFDLLNLAVHSIQIFKKLLNF